MLRLAFLVATTAVFLPAQEPVWAILRENVEAKGQRLRLEDIADVDGLDPQAVARARGIELGPTPAAGQARLLARETIETLLLRSQPLGGRITLRGSPVVRITMNSVTLTGQEAATLARRHLADLLHDHAAVARIEPALTPAPLVIPIGRWSTRFEVVAPKDSDLCGLVRLGVQGIVDDTIVASTSVDLVVRRERKVLVAKTELIPGRTIDPGQLSLETRSAENGVDGALGDPSEARGLVLRNRIAAGAVVTARDFKRLPIVLRNDPVLIQIKSGNLTVRGEGVALQEGSIGDRIPIRTMPGKQLVQARILDSRTVEVTLEPAKGHQ